jgi:predicted outer membrane repeat protein
VFTGAGVFIEESSPKLVGCVFTGCTAQNGGAVWISYYTANHPVFDRCRFSSNQASQYGGAVFSWSELAAFRDCEFAGNSAGEGGALYYGGSGFCEIRNCTLYDNHTAAVFLQLVSAT